MDELGNQFSELSQLIVWPYLAVFVLLSYMAKKHLGKFLQRITKFDWKLVYTVLTFATLLAVPWVIWTDATWVEILVTYAIGTSFHETILSYFEKKIHKK